MTTPVVPVTVWVCACLSVVLVSVFTAVRVGVRIRLIGLRLCSRSPWLVGYEALGSFSHVFTREVWR